MSNDSKTAPNAFENIDRVLVAVKEATNDADRLLAARAVARWFEQMHAELGDRLSAFVDALTVRS